MRGGRRWLPAREERLNEDRMRENGAVLTGEGFLVVLPHGNEVPQAGVELLHDGLESKRRRDRFVGSCNGGTRMNTHGLSAYPWEATRHIDPVPHSRVPSFAEIVATVQTCLGCERNARREHEKVMISLIYGYRSVRSDVLGIFRFISINIQYNAFNSTHCTKRLP